MLCNVILCQWYYHQGQQRKLLIYLYEVYHGQKRSSKVVGLSGSPKKELQFDHTQVTTRYETSTFDTVWPP